MSKQHEKIEPELAEWIARQHVFFVATAPLSPGGHVNASPKAAKPFRSWDRWKLPIRITPAAVPRLPPIFRRMAGSSSCLRLYRASKIVRLHGHGTVVMPGHDWFEKITARFPSNPGTRAYIHIAVTRVSDSCGFSVPFLDYQGPRDTLDRWAEKQGAKSSISTGPRKTSEASTIFPPLLPGA